MVGNETLSNLSTSNETAHEHGNVIRAQIAEEITTIFAFVFNFVAIVILKNIETIHVNTVFCLRNFCLANLFSSLPKLVQLIHCYLVGNGNENVTYETQLCAILRWMETDGYVMTLIMLVVSNVERFVSNLNEKLRELSETHSQGQMEHQDFMAAQHAVAVGFGLLLVQFTGHRPGKCQVPIPGISIELLNI